MTEFKFEKATKKRAKLRMAITGPAKSGKTYTALVLATALVAARGGRIAVIDTERGSASKYADMFEFDVLELVKFHPHKYIAAIKAAETAGVYTALVIDGLSHAWEGKRGVLELHDDATKRSRSENSWAAWREVTPLHRELVDTILQADLDIIATMRSKMAYLQTKDDQGRAVIKKVGLAPVQRQGMEYEFDILAEMRSDHRIVVSDTRCPAMDGATELKPDGVWFQPIVDWLSDGSPEPERMRTRAPVPHWIDGKGMRKAFDKWCDSLGRTEAQVCIIAGVATIRDYTDTRLELKETVEFCVAIEKWAQEEKALRRDQMLDALAVDHPRQFKATPGGDRLAQAQLVITDWVNTQSVATSIIPAPKPGEDPFNQEVMP